MANTISVPVYSLTGEKTGTVSLSKAVFALEEEHPQALHDAVTTYLANRRQATAKTKKRHEVSGGGKKPWRQKGTGRARAGSTRSPIWVGGGTVFGPDGNQNYKRSQNKKAHALAMRCAWSEKTKNGLTVIDDLTIKEVSTKAFAKSLESLKAGKRVLLVCKKEDTNLIYSARNLPTLCIRFVDNVSVYDLLDADTVVVSKADIKTIQEGLE